ncbi:MerR family DNA-binding protein [Pikeienuella piscinae]|uniref:MerR family DNA-binding protein n=1 Tax=Pikeienuella piscinae TaxID=2748098 RepID=A0A7L5BY83_9RHOB|nr:MerR family DNA-binding protein [Pikeienuella piscinae]QIE54854.1 MerR family DNA-binding protein [Pikeienuella piscinae]
MRIGDAAAMAGLPVKTVRYYADIGLVSPSRATNGYRDYSNADARRLGFIGRARALGFTLAECRRLLALYEDETRASADVKAITEEHIAALDAKMAALATLRNELASIADACAGDASPRCPIIEHLASG